MKSRIIDSSYRPITFETVTIKQTDWVESTLSASVAVPGAKDDNVIRVSPDEASYIEFSKQGVRAAGQSAGKVLFKCADLPSKDLNVNVEICD